MTTHKTYQDFLESKSILAPNMGKVAGEPHASLFPFQRDVVRWAVGKGRAAVFLNLGLGKTRIQVEWARLMGENTLIIAPLAVCAQTVREAAAIGVQVTYVKHQGEVGEQGIYITNYERAHLFEAAQFPAVILDESSILKSLDSQMRLRLTAQWKHTPYRLCLSATPAPNDLKELVNHSDFLGIMSRKEVFTSFFINDTNQKGGLKTRLRKAAVQPFYDWLSSWAMAARRPSDLGYSDEGYLLPPMTLERHVVKTGYVPKDEGKKQPRLMFTSLEGVTDRATVQRATLAERIAKAVALVNGDQDQWLVWHWRNDEGYLLRDQIQGAVLVEGATSAEDKAAAFAAFASGEARVLITKPEIAGFGMNFQHCHKTVFTGINDSYEQFYQAVGRVHRFGQASPVQVHVIHADVQAGVWENIQHKQKVAEEMLGQLIEHTQAGNLSQLKGSRIMDTYVERDAQGKGWNLWLGDSIQRITQIATDSVGLSVFSPPFVARYVYSNSDHDMGNARDMAEFMTHFGFLIRELLRVTMPGRNACVHLQQVRVTKRDTGAISLLDFRGATIAAFQEAGWIYDSDYTVDKDAQVQAKRKHHQRLLYKSKDTDSSLSGSALADYLLVFKKPGDNPHPVKNTISDMAWNHLARAVWLDNLPTLETQQRPEMPPDLTKLSKGELVDLVHLLSPVWYNISEQAVIKSQTKGEDDEAHLCPLQLPFIERCIRLWSNPGELILDPFNGVGSTGWVALEQGRRYLGIELSEDYFEIAVQNLREAERLQAQQDLFQYAGIQVDANA